MSPTDKPQWRDSRVLVFSSHVVRDNLLVKPGVTQKPASHKKRPPETPAAQVWEECPRRRRTPLQLYSEMLEKARAFFVLQYEFELVWPICHT